MIVPPIELFFSPFFWLVFLLKFRFLSFSALWVLVNLLNVLIFPLIFHLGVYFSAMIASFVDSFILFQLTLVFRFCYKVIAFAIVMALQGHP